MKELEKIHNIKIQIGNTKFNELEFNTKLTVTRQDINVEERKANNFAAQLGYGDIYGKTIIVSGGTEFTICGVNERARKFPILAKNEFGTYKFPIEVLERIK